MEEVLRNFKRIPCPSGDRCTVPRCQWQHSWEIEAPPESRVIPTSLSQPEVLHVKAAPSYSSLSARSTETLPSHHGTISPKQPPKRKALSPTPTDVGPRKIAKITSASGVVASVSPRRVPVENREQILPAVESRQNEESQKAAGTHTTQQPLKATGKVGVLPAAPSPAARPIKPAKSISAIARAPRPAPKTESLNPRHLPAAPSTHDFRHRVLKMLHDQYVRLNKEAIIVVGDDKPKAQRVLHSPQELITLALDEEQLIATQRPNVYSNVIKMRIMEYKRMKVTTWIMEQEKMRQEQDDKQRQQQQQTMEHTALLAADPVGNTAIEASQNLSVNNQSAPQLGPPIVIQTGLCRADEIRVLRRLAQPIQSVASYGYVATVPTQEEIDKARQGDEASQGYEICDRCKVRFQVFPGRREADGALTSGGKCTFHYGKLYLPPKLPGERIYVPKRFRCCGEVVDDSKGCHTTDTHVFKFTSAARLAGVLPFVETPANPNVPEDRVVAFDCEMGYTVHGLELIRLTAVSWPEGDLLVDVLVRPVGAILDLNTRFSGISAQDMVNAAPYESKRDVSSTKKEPKQLPAAPLTLTNRLRRKLARAEKKASTDMQIKAAPTPEDSKLHIVSSPAAARELFFSIISPKTLLVGHGLENDLNALRVVHPTIVDSVLLYPHPRGLPARFGLKMLMEQHLNKRIQLDTHGAGHDSAEDARAAGELARLAVAKEWTRLQRAGWALQDGVFVPSSAVGKADAGKLSEGYLENGNAG